MTEAFSASDRKILPQILFLLYEIRSGMSEAKTTRTTYI